jgi:salicylate hydroxylase
VASALARYENARRARATELVIQSSQQSKRIHDPILADPQKAVGYIETNWAPEKVKGRYDWIFDYDAATAPI